MTRHTLLSFSSLANARLRMAGLSTLLLVLFSASVRAQFTTTSDGNGGVIISGYTGTGGSLIIPSTINGLTVTGIGQQAFINSQVTGLTIPNSVTSIGYEAFAYSSINAVTLPNNITSIAPSAFYSSGLTSVTIPNSVTSIGDSAFGYCAGLASITIPQGVTTIGVGAFSGCYSLNRIVIPASVTSIGNSAFLNCTNLWSAQFLGNAPTMGLGVFSSTASNFIVYYYGGATGFTSPAWVDSSGNSYNATQIYDTIVSNGQVAITGYNGPGGGAVVIPNTINGLPVTSIEGPAFINQYTISSVTIPNTVTSIGLGAFENCVNLSSITMTNGVTTIGADAFYGCISLRSVTIPGSVTNIGAEAFYDCSILSSAIFQGNAPTTGFLIFGSTASGFVVDYYNGTTGFTSPTWTDSNGDIYPATNLGKISQTITFSTIPDQMLSSSPLTLTASASSGLPVTFTVISGPATVSGSILTFSGTGTVTVEASQSGNNTYEAAPDLQQTFTVSLTPQSITFPVISNKAFGAAPFAVSASASSGLPVTLSIISGPATISGNTITLTGSGIITVQASQGGNSVYAPASSVQQTFGVSAPPGQFTVTINNGQISITGYTGSAGAVVIPSTISGLPVTNIASYAFTNTSITSVIIPSSVTSIGNNAFASCTDLTSISIPNSVTTIGSSAFYLTGLTSVAIPASVTSIGDYTFQSCSGLTNVTIPYGITSIGVNAFWNCSSLTSVTIPVSVSSIGNTAFQYCSSLNSAVFNGNAPTMGSNVFGFNANGFRILYNYGSSGFSTPTWTDSSGDSYPTTQLGTPQSITFPAIANQPFPGSPLTLSATATSALPVSYTLLSGPATLSGTNNNTVTFTGVGTVVIQASQAGNASFIAATSVNQSFLVAMPVPFTGAPTATPENDGVPNLLKYLYDIDPSVPMSASDRGALPTVGIDSTTDPDAEYLTLTYREYALKTGITDSNTGDPIMEVGVIIPSTTTRQFIRLNVTSP
jgi:hypothetical protein